MGRLQKKQSAEAKRRKLADLRKKKAEQEANGQAPAKARAQLPDKKQGSAKGRPPEKGPVFWYASTVQFFREVRMELKKVTWPSRKQTMGSTLVVIVLVVILSLYLGMVDTALSSLVRLVLQQ